jgi:hypothetical protein
MRPCQELADDLIFALSASGLLERDVIVALPAFGLHEREMLRYRPLATLSAT